jgi:hypothetical protein
MSAKIAPRSRAPRPDLTRGLAVKRPDDLAEGAVDKRIDVRRGLTHA